MSLIPFFASDPWDDFRGPLNLFDQHFGHGMHLSDLIQPSYGRHRYYRPWRHAACHHGGKSSVSMDKDGFHVMMDVQQFSPEEITVKHVKDHVVVEGKHEEMPDEHGYISRHFVRRYALPKSVNADALSSSISSDGVLTVTAPKAQALEVGDICSIPITHTGVPAIKNQGSGAEKKPEAKEQKKSK